MLVKLWIMQGLTLSNPKPLHPNLVELWDYGDDDDEDDDGRPGERDHQPGSLRGQRPGPGQRARLLAAQVHQDGVPYSTRWFEAMSGFKVLWCVYFQTRIMSLLFFRHHRRSRFVFSSLFSWIKKRWLFPFWFHTKFSKGCFLSQLSTRCPSDFLWHNCSYEASVSLLRCENGGMQCRCRVGDKETVSLSPFLSCSDFCQIKLHLKISNIFFPFCKHIFSKIMVLSDD